MRVLSKYSVFGGASMTEPGNGWSNNGLKDLFAVNHNTNSSGAEPSRAQRNEPIFSSVKALVVILLVTYIY
jgi:hypothetical protein